MSVAALSWSQLAVLLGVGAFRGVAGEPEIKEAGLELEVGEFFETVADCGRDA